MKSYLSAILFSSLLFFSHCQLFQNNDDPHLPPITTEGKDTFGCLVNGKLFLPKAPPGQGTGVHAELNTAIKDTVELIIYAGNYKQSLGIWIHDTPTLQINKTYELINPKFDVIYSKFEVLPSCDYKTTLDGKVTLLKFDLSNPQNKIIAGTFEFISYSADCQDTVKVTKGRFDIGDVIQ